MCANTAEETQAVGGLDVIFAAKDPIRLFAEITNIVQGHEAHLLRGLKMLFTFSQDPMGNSKFLEVQDALYEALVQQGCDLVLAFPGFVEERLNASPMVWDMLTTSARLVPEEGVNFAQDSDGGGGGAGGDTDRADTGVQLYIDASAYGRR